MANSTESPRPKAYSYIRMSTETQLKGDSLRRQLEASKKYAEAHGLELVQDIELHDIGVSAYSGKNLASGKFGRFLAAVRDGEIEKGSYLLVESFDRMSRQEPIVALQPFMDIVNGGLVLVTLDDERVFSGKISFEDLIISIAKMSRANEESARKSDRLAQAWQAKRNSLGTKKLTARCPSWLRLSDDRTTFEVIEERAAIVRRIFDDAIAGIGAYTIVRRLNADGVPTFTGRGRWQTSTVNKIISGPAAIGIFQPSKMVNGKREAEGALIKDYFPSIIDEATFFAVQSGRLARRTARTDGRKGSGGRKGAYLSNLFSKIAQCGNCGAYMHFENKGAPPKGQSYLVCSNAVRGAGCESSGRWRYDHFEATFLAFVETLDLASIVSSEKGKSTRESLSWQIETIKGKRSALEKQIERAWEVSTQQEEFHSAFIAQKIKDCEIAIAESKVEQEELEARLQTLKGEELDYYRSPEQIRSLISKVRATVGDDVYRVRAIIASRLQSFIQRLVLDPEEAPQTFEVTLNDGSLMILFVDPDDPLRFVQRMRGKVGGDLEMTNEVGEVETVPLDDEGEAGF